MEKTFRMKAKWADTWMDALYFGEYKQGHDQLCNNDGEYCCLGVITEEVNKVQDIGKLLNEDNIVAFGNDQESGVLPKQVIEELGITDMEGNPINNPKLGIHYASDWNDDYGLNFGGIATLIAAYGEFYE